MVNTRKGKEDILGKMVNTRKEKEERRRKIFYQKEGGRFRSVTVRKEKEEGEGWFPRVGCCGSLFPRVMFFR